jgi:hypothetical protein
MKFKLPGEYVLRLGPAFSEEGTPVRKLATHNDPFNSPLFKREFNEDGTIAKDDQDREKEWRVAPLCLRFVFNNEDLASLLIDREALSSADYARYKEFGCPLCILPMALADAGVDKKHNQFWPRSQYLFNVQVLNAPEGSDLEQEVTYAWSAKPGQFDAIQSEAAVDPTIFHPDSGRALRLEATGPADKTRRYKPISFYKEPSPFVNPDKLNDLNDLMIKGVRKFEEMAELLQHNRLDPPRGYDGPEWDAALRMGDLTSVLTK